MTRPDLSARARENLFSTYLAIGRAPPGAEVRETDGYVAVTSDLSHPSGNFAANLQLDPWSAAELREIANSRPAFQVVVLPGDEPAHISELLRRAGFEVVQRMVAMIAIPFQSAVDSEMVSCETPEERRRIGRFMADTFFAREPVTLREAMAEAMVEATSLSVHARFVRERPVAAVMLARSGGMVGIYNLCVAGSQQGRGLGGEVVRWCLAQAAKEERTVCLQCVPSLEPWYRRHGFDSAGIVTVWSLREG